ncbi:MAG: S8 family peptidase [Candidatus Aegiribacteria sp.]
MRLLLLIVAGMATVALSAGIHPEVLSAMGQAGPGEMVPVVVLLEGSLDHDWIQAATSEMDRAERQQFVVQTLKDRAGLARQGVMVYLQDNPVDRIVPFWLVNGIYCETTAETIRELSARDDVRYIDHGAPEASLIEPVERREPLSEEIERGLAWGVDKINADDVWALGYEGQDVIVGVIDTGVDYYHSDLSSNMWHDTPAGYHYGYNFYGSGDPLDPMDDYGHGTHCAGTIAGDGTSGTETGVAPSATIMALRIYYYTGGYPTWIEAMEFAAEHGASVLSMSMGTSPVGNATLREAEENVLLAGIYHSVAAGNNGSGSGTILASGDCPPPWFHPDQAYQLGQSAVVTAGATDSGDQIAGFSSRGPVTWWGSVAPWNDYGDSQPLIKPDISAPGVDVLSTQLGGGYTTMSGTSMATPHVAGVAALLLSVNPNLTVAQLDSLIEITSLDLGTAGKDNTFGAGRVDAYQAALAAMEVGVGDNTGSTVQPSMPLISGIHPNPVRTSAAFSLFLPVEGEVTLNVHDMAGRVVAQVHSGYLQSGSHSYLWNFPEDLGSGIYFLRASTPAGAAVSRMALVR